MGEAGDAAGLGTRGMIRASTKESDIWASGKLQQDGMLSDNGLEDRVRRYWGNALRQLPLKGAGSITEMLGLSRGELEVPAGELMDRMFKDPNNKDLEFVMDLYNKLDVEQGGSSPPPPSRKWAGLQCAHAQRHVITIGLYTLNRCFWRVFRAATDQGRI